MRFTKAPTSLLVAAFALRTKEVVAEHDKADAGILSSHGRDADRMLAAPQQCGLNGYVDCDNGFVKGQIGVSCHDACQGTCCTSSYGCHNFTGKVCRDGSCDGTEACKFATIPLVANSCKGDYACYHVAKDGGKIGDMENSCIGYHACFRAAYNGTIGRVVNSCLGVNACEAAAQYQGYIGGIEGSCNGDISCSFAAHSGTIGGMVDSCLGRNACQRAAKYHGSIGKIDNSCQGLAACRMTQAGNHPNTPTAGGKVIAEIVNSCKGYGACHLALDVGRMVDSCNGNEACRSAGWSAGWFIRGGVGNVTSSCNSDYACFEVGFQGLFIGDITDSCNADEACKYVGNEIEMHSNLFNCCNKQQACIALNEATLPAQCRKTSKVSSCEPDF